MLPNEALDGGSASIMEYLSDPAKRAVCRRHVFEEREIQNTPVPTLIADGYADHIFIGGVSLEKIAKNRGVDSVEAAFDILLENGGRLGIVLQHHDEPDLRILETGPLVMIESERQHPSLRRRSPESPLLRRVPSCVSEIRSRRDTSRGSRGRRDEDSRSKRIGPENEFLPCSETEIERSGHDS